jgi:hypothetical protein
LKRQSGVIPHLYEHRSHVVQLDRPFVLSLILAQDVDLSGRDFVGFNRAFRLRTLEVSVVSVIGFSPVGYPAAPVAAGREDRRPAALAARPPRGRQRSGE